MEDVEPPRLACHPAGEAVCGVGIVFHGREDAQDGKPAVGAGMDIVQHGRNGVVLAQIAQGVRDAKYSRRQIKHPPPLAQPLHDFIVGEQEIPGEEAEPVDAEPIYRNDGGVQHLCGTINNDHQQCDAPDRCLGTEVPEPVFFHFPHGQQEHREQPEHLDVPQRPHAGQHRNQIQHRLRDGGKVHAAANFYVVKAEDPLEHEQADRGRDQQLARFVLQKLLRGVALQAVPRAHARHNEQQCHEPGVDQIQETILELMLPNAKGLHAVEHVDHMVDHNKDDSRPADVI